MPATPQPTLGAPHPVAASHRRQRLPGFVVLTDLDPRIHADIRYATPHNFVGRPITGYREPLCLLTRQAAEALRRVQDAALTGGHSLKVYDCYRPQPAVDDFVAWSKRPGEQQTKAEFYPDLAKNRLFADGYIGAPTAHSRGSTLDLTLVDEPAASQPPYRVGQPLVACTAPRGQRFADNSIDMGTGFDCFDPRAHTADPRDHGDGAGQPSVVAAADDRRRVRQLRPRVVALQPARRAVPGHVLRRPGRPLVGRLSGQVQ